MLLAFTFILLSIGVGILVSVYSIFFPFIKNLGEIGNYNTAYYAAISSVERGELALKYRDPGFNGSGGYLNGSGRGPTSDAKLSGEDFGFVSIDPNGMRREITSRTNNIPATDQGNVEYLLADATSTDYNMLNYSTAEKIILSYDNTTDTGLYYTGGQNLAYFDGKLQGTLRLPPKVVSGFGGMPSAELCTTCDIDDDELGDDIITDRSLEGYKKGMYFKIVPNVSTLYYSGSHVDESKDIAIRESIINDTGELDFTTFDPILPSNSLLSHVVIANNPGEITNPFYTILGNPDTYTGLVLNLGLINLLTTNNGNVYPFLEYQLRTNNPIADRFYTIQGWGRIGDYEVQVVAKKPTSQGSIAGSFTVIF